MPGELVDDSVVIRDSKEGSQLYNKGNFGYPLSGGGLELDLVEAAFLLEAERLEVVRKGVKLSFEELFLYSSSVHEGFDITYIVYRDIRQRGFIVKTESGRFDLSVFPRGSNMSNSRPLYLVRTVSERTALDITEFSGEISETDNIGKQLLYGVVDEEGDLTYYNMSKRDPTGSVPVRKATRRASGSLISGRVFVFGKEDADALRESGFYGKMMDDTLQLSLIESCYLIGNGELEVSTPDGKKMSLKAVSDFGRKTQDEFDIRLRAFTDLRGRGLVVKTGFKYGTHFRSYEKSPDDCHARYLVHAVSASKVTMWPEISRTVRLSGGVKKDILFCRVSDTVEYLEFKWFRP
jgi:tRNA-intron endonuclease